MKIARLVIILVAAAGLSVPLFLLEFWVAGWTRWKWLGDLLFVPGGIVQDWLVASKIVPPLRTGGHMPDLGYVFLFDLAVNYLLAFASLYFFERLYLKRTGRKGR
jgi:hypothetical protein